MRPTASTRAAWSSGRAFTAGSTAHAGDQLTLVAPIDGLADEIAANGSAAVDIAPGCNRSRGRCWDRFNNGLNHGGFPDFTGNEIFTSRIA